VTFNPPSVIADAFDQLLPYVDGRLWPKVTDETLRHGFVGYAPSSERGRWVATPTLASRPKPDLVELP
jgi:hypothetical protein